MALYCLSLWSMLVKGCHLHPPTGHGESITKVLVGLVLDREHVQRRDLGRAFEVGDGLHTTDADGIGHWSVDHVDALAGELHLRSLMPTQMILPNCPSAHLSSNAKNGRHRQLCAA